MRRKKQKITDRLRIEKIIQSAEICRLGLSLENKPYIVPLNFGYKDNILYVHSACEGRKIDIIKNNNNVCFEIEANTRIIEGASSCKWTMHYQSIIGSGKAFFIDKTEDKIEALDIIMKHYTDKDSQFPEAALKITAVIKIEIEEMTAKQNGYPELSVS